MEHTITRLKKFRIMGDEFRNRPRNYDATTDIVSGLVNVQDTRTVGERGVTGVDACGFCGQRLGVGRYWRCRVCGASYRFTHRDRHVCEEGVQVTW